MSDLELILNAVNNLGGEAKTAFIAYLVISYGTILVLVGSAIAAVFIIFSRLIRHISRDGLICRYRNILGTGTRGYLSDEERERTLALLDQISQEYVNRLSNKP